MNDTTKQTAPKPEPAILTQFRKDTAEHQMEVLLDQGAYRHLRFAKPGTNCYHFNIVTWPSYLAISGDMGASVFSRLADMFEFFRTPDHLHEGAHGLYINRGYWCEKLVANDGPAKAYDQELLTPMLRDVFEDYMSGQDLDGIDNGHALAQALWEQIEQDVYGDDARQAIASAEAFEPASWSDHGKAFSDFAFTDMWERASSLEDYTFHMIWRLYAVSHAVRTYDAWKAAQNADVVNDGRVLTCVYCAKEYPQGTPAAGDKVLTDHIKVCEKHPLRDAEAKVAKLRAALYGILGLEGPEHLAEMEAVIRAMPGAAADKAVTIDAIHALQSLEAATHA